MTSYSSPGSISQYISDQKGLQLPTRFQVYLQRPNESEVSFMCNMVYFPSKKIKVFQDQLSGSTVPIPVPYGLNYSTNLVQFALEESWVSRAYFERWMSGMFVTPNGQTTSLDILNSRPNFYDEVAGKMRIEALSRASTDGAQIINAEYILNGCIPIEMIPVKFDSSIFNAPINFAINMLFKTYSVSIQTR